ncbi:MAG: hypothetical protein ACI3ZC_03530 [Candidatus Cryptobacteroides sp.]
MGNRTGHIFPAIFAVLSGLSGIAVSGLIAVSCGPRGTELPRGDWNNEVHEVLSQVIAEDGTDGRQSGVECRPYAVFDFDNTTIVNDISMTLMLYQIENLRYEFPPEDAFGVFSAWIPDLDTVMTGVGMTVREVCSDLAADYAALYPFTPAGGGDRKEPVEGAESGRFLPSEPESEMCIIAADGKEGKPGGADFRPGCPDFREMPEYLDFRAKLAALERGIEYTFSYADWCLWMPALFSGMTSEELAGLTVESADFWLTSGRTWTETWSSPDGKVSTEVLKGMLIPEDSIRLFKTLRRNGFGVYICSASLEIIVEAMACNEKYDLGFSPDEVFGLRMTGDMEDGNILGANGFDPDYNQTFLDGKVKCIEELIAPRHCGRTPSLVAGDSSGDYAMLTSFSDLKAGLIINRGHSPLRSLATTGESGAHSSGKSVSNTNSCTTKYVVQDRF